MHAPILNAEASLYRTSAYYGVIGAWTDEPRGRVLPAQLPPCGTFTNCVVDPVLFANCPGHCGHRCGIAGTPPILECCPPEKCGTPPPSDDPCCRKVCCRANCE